MVPDELYQRPFPEDGKPGGAALTIHEMASDTVMTLDSILHNEGVYLMPSLIADLYKLDVVSHD